MENYYENETTGNIKFVPHRSYFCVHDQYFLQLIKEP